MAEERRSAPRARLSGVRVTYESAAGDHVETEATNIGPGGLFVLTAKPLAVGKRIALEIQVAGELAPWSALGRVVWAREHDTGQQRPPGMGVKLIDVEDVVVSTIERLVKDRELTEPEIAPAAPLPSREPTVLGVGSSADGTSQVPPERRQTPDAAPPAPIVSVAPSRERTILGVGSAQPAEESRVPEEPKTPQTPTTPPVLSAMREPSVVIDLVDRDEKPPYAPHEAALASEAPPVGKRRSAGRWIVVLVLLAVAGAATYAFLGGDFDRVLRLSEPAVAPRPAPAPLPTNIAPALTTAATSTSPPMTSARASASISPASSSEPRRTPSAFPSQPSSRASAPPAAISANPPSLHPPPSIPASPSKKPATEDNPY
jgi:uncharacterized protein (TIGR02266 family)